MKRKATPNATVVISDLHAGCQMGLCPPHGVRLDDGGQYLPNTIQKAVWAWWREFWDEFVPMATKGGTFDVIVNGDAIDNEHHAVKTLISNNIETQRRIAIELLTPVAAKAREFYMVRGTDAHDGGHGQDVESIARTLDAIPDDTGRFARWEINKRIDGPDKECIANCLHHIGGSGGSHYDTSAPKRELIEAFIEAARAAERPPTFVVRSHRHRYTQVVEMTDWGRSYCLVTPSWQAKTGLAHKIAGARVSPPQFGGAVLVNGSEECYARVFWKRLKKSRVV